MGRPLLLLSGRGAGAEESWAVTGTDVMPVVLNAADRPLFLGSRPTLVVPPMGVPRAVEPLPRLSTSAA